MSSGYCGLSRGCRGLEDRDLVEAEGVVRDVHCGPALRGYSVVDGQGAALFGTTRVQSQTRARS